MSWPWCPASTPFTVWDPLSFLVEEAHRRGIEVHPYNAVGYTGMTGIDYQSGTRLPEWRLTRFANDHPELWMRRQDGKTCFDVSGSVVLSYGTREARLYEQQPFLEMARDYDVDGVQLEFQIESVPGQVDDHGVMVYGYEQAIVQDYRRETGRDAPWPFPTTIGTGPCSGPVTSPASYGS